MLIQKAANLLLADKSGNQAIHDIAKAGDYVLLNLLVQHGANTEAKNIDGQTGLHIAAVYGKFEACRTLLLAGAKVNSFDKKVSKSSLLAVSINPLDSYTSRSCLDQPSQYCLYVIDQIVRWDGDG